MKRIQILGAACLAAGVMIGSDSPASAVEPRGEQASDMMPMMDMPVLDRDSAATTHKAAPRRYGKGPTQGGGGGRGCGRGCGGC